MRQKTGPQTLAAEKTVKDIRWATRKHHSWEEKIRIVLEGQRREDSIAAICRREGSIDTATLSNGSSTGSNSFEASQPDMTSVRKITSPP